MQTFDNLSQTSTQHLVQGQNIKITATIEAQINAILKNQQLKGVKILWNGRKPIFIGKTTI